MSTLHSFGGPSGPGTTPTCMLLASLLGIVVLGAGPEPTAAQATSATAQSTAEIAPTASQMARVTTSWKEAPIHDVLRAFAVYSGRSIVAGAGVAGVFVTADIRDQRWDVALQTILLSQGLSAVEEGHGIIRVDTFEGLQSREAVQPVVTRSYRISYARAAELRATIASLLTERGSVSALESTNTLVVSDVPRVQGVVARLLGR